MTPARKTATSKIAIAIKAIPLVNCAINARRRVILRQALSLYRNDKFLSAALWKQIWLFAITSTAFAFSLYSTSSDPSVIVRVAKPLTVFFPVLYPAMKAYFGAKEYARRKSRFMHELEMKAAERNAH